MSIRRIGASFQADIDQDNANTVEDYRTVLFNNGLASNASVRALFSDGLSPFLELPDLGLQSRYSFSAAADPSVIPTPAALPLLVTALGWIGLLGARRRIFAGGPRLS